MCGKYRQSRRSAALYLLYHDHVRAEHFETSSEEHDVAPAQNQAECHHDGLALHLAGPEHAQQHHQAGVADTGGRGKQRDQPRMSQITLDYVAFYNCFCSQDNMEGPSQGSLAKITLHPDSYNIRNLVEDEEE